MDLGAILQPKALPALMAISTAARFREGSAPGNPRQTGHTCVLGGAPNAVGLAQKIFERVSSCACTSRPMTGSKSAAGIFHQGGQLFGEPGARLIGVGEAEQGLLVERLADELQPDRQPLLI